ncbi:MAG TPA: DUF262 domain-containing protein [Solirubrobacteraceae bacterium]
MSAEAEEPEVSLDESGEEGDVVTIVDVNERAEAIAEAQPISYFGSDFDVHGLVRRLGQDDIIVPAFDPTFEPDGEIQGFQRGFVWRRYQMDRFVESLLLGYPIPGIFLVQQPDRKLLVLDGQQRLRTLQQFYAGAFYNGEEFVLETVADAFKGLSYGGLAEEDRRALDNTFIHATIVKYDSDAGGERAVYQLFERLNTGGTNLYPQEIRVALYRGPLVDFVRDLNSDPNWRSLYGPTSGRLKDQELILRFLAFYTESAQYERPLKGFLNDFLSRHRDLNGLDAPALQERFAETCAVVQGALGRAAFRIQTQVNAALVDSIMVGVARRLEHGPINDLDSMRKAFSSLLEDSEFVSAIARATADEDRVARRISKATAAFAPLA